MTTQPEALRLADALDVGEISYTGMCKAAAELRRLHSVNAELLEALKVVVDRAVVLDAFAVEQARAAIQKAEEVNP